MIIIAISTADARQKAEKIGVTEYHHVKNPEGLRGVERGSYYVFTSAAIYSMSCRERQEFDDMISRRELKQF